MIAEMTGPGGWGVLDLAGVAASARPVVAADIGYGDNALFRQQLTDAGWQYAVAVKGRSARTTAMPSRRPALRRARPAAQARLSRAAGDPAPARDRAAAQVRPVTWRQGTKISTGNPAPP